jgi:23S rRNA (guanosine2251-2'-O)-methyltransferase
VPLAVVPNLVRAVEKLKDAGFWVFGADGSGTPLSQARIPGRTVLVMGSEGKGISRLLRENCDALVSIETRGRLDSLNVSVAAGILLYEICNRGAPVSV